MPGQRRNGWLSLAVTAGIRSPTACRWHLYTIPFEIWVSTNPELSDDHTSSDYQSHVHQAGCHPGACTDRSLKDPRDGEYALSGGRVGKSTRFAGAFDRNLKCEQSVAPRRWEGMSYKFCATALISSSSLSAWTFFQSDVQTSWMYRLPKGRDALPGNKAVHCRTAMS